MTTNDRTDAARMLDEWDELDPYGYRDALLDYAGNDRDKLMELVAADLDGMREMLDELRDETC
jgi:hypothetical protein